MDSQIDHTAGLLFLREGAPLSVYCTDSVYEDLTSGFPVLHMLDHYCRIDRYPLPLQEGSYFTIPGVSNLRFTAVALDSKAPPYSPHRHRPHRGDNIGVRVGDTNSGRNLFYAPGVGTIDATLTPFLENADCLLIDGTFWSEDEMLQAGAGSKQAREMGHLPQSGQNGMLAQLQQLSRPRKILIHINNTNPILNEDSSERAILNAAGIEVAYDGLEIHL